MSLSLTVLPKFAPPITNLGAIMQTLHLCADSNGESTTREDLFKISPKMVEDGYLNYATIPTGFVLMCCESDEEIVDQMFTHIHQYLKDNAGVITVVEYDMDDCNDKDRQALIVKKILELATL